MRDVAVCAQNLSRDRQHDDGIRFSAEVNLAKSSLPALKFKPTFFGHLQENSVWYACTCYHPLFLFNQFGDLERCALRPRIKYDIRLPTASCRNGSAICSNAPLAERVLAQQPAIGQKRGTPSRRQERPRPTHTNPFHAPGEEWDVTDCPPAIIEINLDDDEESADPAALSS